MEEVFIKTTPIVISGVILFLLQLYASYSSEQRRKKNLKSQLAAEIVDVVFSMKKTKLLIEDNLNYYSETGRVGKLGGHEMLGSTLIDCDAFAEILYLHKEVERSNIREFYSCVNLYKEHSVSYLAFVESFGGDINSCPLSIYKNTSFLHSIYHDVEHAIALASYIRDKYKTTRYLNSKRSKDLTESIEYRFFPLMRRMRAVATAKLSPKVKASIRSRRKAFYS